MSTRLDGGRIGPNGCSTLVTEPAVYPNESDARALLEAARSRTAHAASLPADQLVTQRVLADRIRTEHDLRAALVYAVLDVAAAIRETRAP